MEAVHGMVGDGDDVLHVNTGAGLTAVHLASLLSVQDSIIFTVGCNSDDQYKRVARNVERLRAASEIKVQGVRDIGLGMCLRMWMLANNVGIF